MVISWDDPAHSTHSPLVESVPAVASLFAPYWPNLSGIFPDAFEIAGVEVVRFFENMLVSKGFTSKMCVS